MIAVRLKGAACTHKHTQSSRKRTQVAERVIQEVSPRLARDKEKLLKSKNMEINPEDIYVGIQVKSC